MLIIQSRMASIHDSLSLFAILSRSGSFFLCIGGILILFYMEFVLIASSHARFVTPRLYVSHGGYAFDSGS